MLCVLGHGVLRRPSFEEKSRHTSSPAGSDVVGGSSRSDSPSAFWDTTQHAVDVTDIYGPLSTTVYRPTVSRDADSTSVAGPAVSVTGRPFIAVTSRTRSPVIVSSRPVSGPPRQFISTPPAPVAPTPLSAPMPSAPVVPPLQAPVVPTPLAPVAPTLQAPSVLAVVSSTPLMSSVTAAFIAPTDSCVTAVTAFVGPSHGLAGTSVGPSSGLAGTSSGFSITAATALLPAQLGFATLPLDCHHDDTVTSSLVPPSATGSQVIATVRSSRQPAVVLQQVHSCEVAWPTAQRATAPALTRLACDTVSDTMTPTTRDVTATITATTDICRTTPANVMSSSVSFVAPYDKSSHTVNVSPPAASSAVTEKPSTSLDKPPPPPYPGRSTVHSTPALRPTPPPPSSDIAALTMTERDVQLSERDVHPPAQDTDIDAGPAADDSTDDDVATATECQRIESPKPVRRAGDDNRCETKVPAAYLIISV